MDLTHHLSKNSRLKHLSLSPAALDYANALSEEHGVPLDFITLHFVKSCETFANCAYFTRSLWFPLQPAHEFYAIRFERHERTDVITMILDGEVIRTLDEVPLTDEYHVMRLIEETKIAYF